MSTVNPPDPDDFFADTRMSFGDHIEDLRTHLIRAIYGFLVAMFFSLFIGSYVLDYITAPVKSQLAAYYKRRAAQITSNVDTNPTLKRINEQTHFVGLTFYRPQLQALLEGKSNAEVNQFRRPRLARPEEAGKGPTLLGRLFGSNERAAAPMTNNDVIVPPDELVTLWVSHSEPVREIAELLDATRHVNQLDDPTTLSPMEAFMVFFKVCMLCGVVIGSPWIFYQIWAFVAAGLYPHEKRLVHVYLPFSLGLFLGGVFLCEIFVIPKALETLLWFNEWLDLKPDIRLNEWLSFAILLPLVFGVSFQTPLVMMFMVRLGIVDVETLRSKRRMAWFVMALFAALITPTPDAITMMLLWLPMSLLFELGLILVARMAVAEPFDDSPDQEEFVGA